MQTWLLIGAGLILWAIYDLFTGQVWLHRKFIRKEEPWAYWTTWTIWAIVALTVFLGSWS